MATPTDSPTPRSPRLVLQFASLLFVGFAAAACSSQAPVALDDSRPVRTEVEQSSETATEPEALAPIDEVTSTTEQDLLTQVATSPETTASPQTSTPAETPRATEPPSTTAPEPVEPIFSQDSSVTHVRVDTAGDSLNVRSAPGVDASIVGELASVTWYVETTGNVADLGGNLWREVKLQSGETGWVSARFVQQTTLDCTAINPNNALEVSRPWEANLDGDGLADFALYVRQPDETTHVLVQFGNGATTSTQIARSIEFPSYDVGWVVAQDYNGDGFDELEVSVRWEHDSVTHFFDQQTQIFTMNGCDFREAAKFDSSWSETGFTGFHCTDFGTDDVMVWRSSRNADEFNFAEAHSFDPATGFTLTGEERSGTDEEFYDFFDPQCSDDFD